MFAESLGDSQSEGFVDLSSCFLNRRFQEKVRAFLEEEKKKFSREIQRAYIPAVRSSILLMFTRNALSENEQCPVGKMNNGRIEEDELGTMALSEKTASR